MPTSSPPLPTLPHNPLGEAPDLPDNPLGTPPTPPLRVGRHGPLGRAGRAPRPPGKGIASPQAHGGPQARQPQTVKVQVEQAKPPLVARDQERLPGKPVSARAREAKAALEKMQGQPQTAGTPAERKRTLRERLAGMRVKPDEDAGGPTMTPEMREKRRKQFEEMRRTLDGDA